MLEELNELEEKQIWELTHFSQNLSLDQVSEHYEVLYELDTQLLINKALILTMEADSNLWLVMFYVFLQHMWINILIIINKFWFELYVVKVWIYYIT